ncbi:hypothetical protein [Tautonia plasticadhaerens]|uniref:Uncharacterized protein n=1 Tax=Tautonia plasticadhaerens TaxID=2527974 RepID=A0A518H0A6_9BACT|nr:hypothetical protein [Tautonia plasticadhaerens]QDV34274.1 hypothetical protein ElP_21590 [Tautonia plasticadhaerens]
MGTPSPKQVEANRRNAQRSTGPRTPGGKHRSRSNGLKHGFAALVVVPESDRAAYEAELARWRKEAGPENVVEDHLVLRAAVGSVALKRLDRAREDSRQEAAREEVRSWEDRQRHRARRRAQDLPKDPGHVLFDLEASAFGCDWLIRRWESLDAPLRLGNGWDQRTVLRAQLLLGLPEGLPGPDAEPEVRLLWRLAASCSPSTVTRIPDAPGEDPVPADPAGARAALRAFIAEQVDRLVALREESWAQVEGPSRDAVVSRAMAADPSTGGQLRQRYARDADRSANAAVRLYLNLRDRRRRELLERSKEARHCTLPRAPVGGGWWRELDSDPTPPGFERIGVDAACPGLDLGPDLSPSIGTGLAPGPEAIPIPPEPSSIGARPRSGPRSSPGSIGRRPRPPPRSGRPSPRLPRPDSGPNSPVRRDGPNPFRRRNSPTIRRKSRTQVMSSDTGSRPGLPASRGAPCHIRPPTAPADRGPIAPRPDRSGEGPAAPLPGPSRRPEGPDGPGGPGRAAEGRSQTGGGLVG